MLSSELDVPCLIPDFPLCQRHLNKQESMQAQRNISISRRQKLMQCNYVPLHRNSAYLLQLTHGSEEQGDASPGHQTHREAM